MPLAKRTTICFDPEIYEGLQEEQVAKNRTSISEMVNEAVRQLLIDYEQDAEDLAELEQRRSEGNIPFEDVVADLKSRGLL
jgi:Arc/MetJ-type ribon-helix-helix transcriptional regulator